MDKRVVVYFFVTIVSSSCSGEKTRDCNYLKKKIGAPVDIEPMTQIVEIKQTVSRAKKIASHHASVAAAIGSNSPRSPFLGDLRSDLYKAHLNASKSASEYAAELERLDESLIDEHIGKYNASKQDAERITSNINRICNNSD